MVLPVRRRIHWGMGLFCFWALPSFCLVLKVFWLCLERNHILSASGSHHADPGYPSWVLAGFASQVSYSNAQV